MIGLFAKLIGLGGLSKRVMKIFKKIRKRVDKAVNKLLKKAKKAGRKLMRKLGIGKKKKKGQKPDDDKRTDAEKKADLHKGVQEGTDFIKQEGHSKKEIKKKLEQIEDKHDLKELKLVTDGENKGHIHGEVNPTEDGPMVPISFVGSTIKVGEHPLVGTDLESHHVPANEFSKTIGDFYGEVGALLPNDDNFGNLRERLITRKADIANTYGEEGKGLSAILIHEKTHRTANKAVHQTAIQPQVFNNIRKEANPETGTGKTAVIVIPKSGEKRTIANLSSNHWKSFLEQVYRIEKAEGSVELNKNATKDGELITIKGGDTDAMTRVANEITAKANAIQGEHDASKEISKIESIVDKTSTSGFEKALNNGMHAVSVALKESTHDGDKSQHGKVLKSMRSTASKIWKKLVIKKI